MEESRPAIDTKGKDDKSSHVRAEKLAGCEVNAVQSEVSQKEFWESNRRSPVKAASEEDDEENKEESMAEES